MINTNLLLVHTEIYLISSGSSTQEVYTQIIHTVTQMAHVHNSTLNSRGHEHHKISSDPDFIEQHTDFYEAAGQTCV